MDTHTCTCSVPLEMCMINEPMKYVLEVKTEDGLTCNILVHL